MRRLGVLSHCFQDAPIPEFLVRILGPALCFRDSVTEDDQRVARRQRQRFFLVSRIGEEAKRTPSRREVANGMVVHEDRTALSGIAVSEPTLGRHDPMNSVTNRAGMARRQSARFRWVIVLAAPSSTSASIARMPCTSAAWKAAGAPLPQTSPSARRNW